MMRSVAFVLLLSGLATCHEWQTHAGGFSDCRPYGFFDALFWYLSSVYCFFFKSTHPHFCSCFEGFPNAIAKTVDAGLRDGSSVSMTFHIPLGETCERLNRFDGPSVRVCDAGPCGGKPLQLPLYDNEFYESFGMHYYKTLILYYEVDNLVSQWGTFPRRNAEVSDLLQGSIAHSYKEHGDPLDLLIQRCTKRTWPQSWVNSSYMNGHIAGLFGYDVILVAQGVTDAIIDSNKLKEGEYETNHVFIPDVACGVEVAAASLGDAQFYVMTDSNVDYSLRYTEYLKSTTHTISDVCGRTNLTTWARSASYPGNADPKFSTRIAWRTPQTRYPNAPGV